MTLCLMALALIALYLLVLYQGLFPKFQCLDHWWPLKARYFSVKGDSVRE
ncbi:MAG: hypothetical protein ACJAYG_001463 [Oceanicoccus sp.]|jgi:hypothetical protein